MDSTQVKQRGIDIAGLPQHVVKEASPRRTAGCTSWTG